MKSLFVASLSLIFLSGCSVYKSDGRKDFESAAPGKISATSMKSAAVAAAPSFQLKSCKKEGRLETWFNEEFPSTNYELVVAENDLEIWRTTRSGVIEVKAIQKTDTATHTCVYEFSTFATWDLLKEQFIRELENNLMTVD
ncbi:MAG: hypothetical protein J7501_06375 [Bdellovibrio sp.]|nr:hypothetical protein [Bdellovibrio sp.]